MIFEIAKCIGNTTAITTEENFEFEDDIEINDALKEKVYLLKSVGIIKGIGNNLLAPKAKATYGEFSAIIKKMVEYKYIIDKIN